MFALLIAVGVSAAGGCLAYLFKDTILAAIFRKPDPTQQAIDKQRQMDQNLINPPSEDQTSKDLKDGSF